MKFVVTIDRDEDGVWVVECPSIPGCVSQGDSLHDALDSIREAILLCLDARRHGGRPPPVETPELVDEEVRACVKDRAEEGLPPTVDTRVLEVEAEVAL